MSTLARAANMHLHTSISTDEVPATDRLAYFREALMAYATPTEVYVDPKTEFSARMEASGFGDITLMTLTGRTRGRRGLRRTPGLIRRSDPGGYSLVLYQQGRAVLDHGHGHVELSPGDMTLINTSRPFDGWYESGDSRLVSLAFPQGLLRLPASVNDRLRGTRLCTRTGVGALLRTFITQLARELGHCRPTDTIRLSTTLLDLVHATLAGALEAAGALPDDSRQRALFEQLKAFIETRLGDPELTPTTVAEAHHISIRTLHRLFAAHDRTVADWIRNRRLERCAGDLVNPSMTDQPVHAIAARWGLHSAAHFSRLFRTTYGLSPQDYRRQFSAAAL